MKRDPNRYYPPGYCGTHDLIEAAYYHLFPTALQDSELIAAALKYSDFEQDLYRNIQRLKAHGVPKEAEREIRSEIGRLETEMALTTFVERAMSDGLFDPVLSLFPPYPEFEFVNFPMDRFEYVYEFKATKPDWPEHQGPPHHIREIGNNRFRDVSRLIRDRLIGRNLKCYFAHFETGFSEFTRTNRWLNTEFFQNVILTGLITIEEHSCDIMFDGRELEKEFPPLGSSSSHCNPSESKVGETPSAINMDERIAEALVKIHPDGIPREKYGYISQLRRKLEDMTGIKEITNSTWQRAKTRYERRITGSD